MSNANTTSVSNETLLLGCKNVFKHGKVVLDLASPVRKTLSDLNIHADTVFDLEVKTRHVTYVYVAALVDAAREFAGDAAVNAQMTDFFDALFGTPKNSEIGANPYLRLVRAADGEWLTETNSRNVVSYKWVPNRSSEKYAAVCRFAVDYGFTGSNLLDFFMGKEKISYSYNGKSLEAEPTINGIIAADRQRYKTAGRKVLDKSDWQTIDGLKPLVTIPYTEKLKEAFTLSEGGLGIASIRVIGNQLHIYGNAGKQDNEVHRIFKQECGNISLAYYKASQKSDEPATLDEALVRDDA